MATQHPHRGTWIHRVLLFGFGGLLTLLFIWLLAFVISDVGDIEGPNFTDIEAKYVDKALKDELEDLQKQSQDLEKQVENQRQIQGILQTSTQNSRETMDQLVAIHKLNLEKGVKPTAAEQEALAQSEAQFLENQGKFQEANEEIARLSEQNRDIQRQIAVLSEELEAKREPAREEYKQVRERHELKVAAFKLAVVVPLLLAAAALAFKKRGSAYTPIIYPAFAASFWTTGVTMFEHFPRDYFKYIAVGAAIAIVLAILVHLIRTLTRPRPDWLLKQYKEAYNKGRCPVCAYPVGRGAMAALRVKRWGTTIIQGAEGVKQGSEPYVCPSCGTGLYEACASCGKVRHALLPYCEHCGVGNGERVASSE